MKILSVRATRNPKTISEFVKNIRTYEQSSIVTVGSRILWDLFRNKEATNNADNILARAFGSKIIVLAMATCNTYRSKKLSTYKEFVELCAQVHSLEESITNDTFLQNESEEIFNSLIEPHVSPKKYSSKKLPVIPKKYLSKEVIRECVSVLWLQRGVVEQNLGFMADVKEIYRDYAILKSIDAANNNLVATTFANELNLTLLQVIRAGLFNFSLAMDGDGLLDFSILSCDRKITEELDVDINTCKLVASHTSYKESDLRPIWYEGTLLKEKQLYQRYVPLPILKQPILFLNKHNSNEYRIVSPELYTRGFRQAIFSMIYEKNSDSVGDIGNAIGNAIECHIQSALEYKFGKKSVSKLEHEGKQADLLVELESITLIIEIKSDIGDLESKNISSPKKIANMWRKLYGACEQCKNSIEENKPISNKIICIIIIAGHITGECITFQRFADRSGIFKDMGIEAIEFLSWNSLENALFQTSTQEFQRALLEKWSKKGRGAVGEKSSLKFERDTSASQPDFYNSIEQEILRLNCFGGMDVAPFGGQRILSLRSENLSY